MDTLSKKVTYSCESINILPFHLLNICCLVPITTIFLTCEFFWYGKVNHPYEKSDLLKGLWNWSVMSVANCLYIHTFSISGYIPTGKDFMFHCTTFFSGSHFAVPMLVLNFGESASLGTGTMMATLLAVDRVLNWLRAWTAWREGVTALGASGNLLGRWGSPALLRATIYKGYTSHVTYILLLKKCAMAHVCMEACAENQTHRPPLPPL